MKDRKKFLLKIGIIEGVLLLAIVVLVVLKLTVFSGSGKKPKTDKRDLGGLEVTMLDWWTEDTWGEESSDYDKAFFDMLHKAEQEHNFKFSRYSDPDYFWGDDYTERIALSITNNIPIASMFVLDSRWVASFLEKGLLLDVSKASTVQWDDDKWNAAVARLMSIHGGQYGFACGTEYGSFTGVFFNKAIFKMMGVDPDLPYDLQSEGKWNWEEFRHLCMVLTKDLDNDGIIDIHGVSGDPELVCYGALLSNGTDLFTKDGNGLLTVNANDEKVIESLNFVHSLSEDCYFLPMDGIYGDADSGWWWDWYRTGFYEGRAAMYIDEEWFSENVGAGEMELGFVAFPYGPSVDGYVSVIREPVVALPNCDAVRDIADDILYAYNIATEVPEGYKREDGNWKLFCEPYFSDERAVNESIYRMLFEYPQAMASSALMTDILTDSTEAMRYWAFGMVQDNAGANETIEAFMARWQTNVDLFNSHFTD